MTSENNLRLESVSVETLEAVSVSVTAGEVVGLSGPSGSGKTRLLRAVTAGPRALLLDEPTTNLDAEAVARTERWLLKYIRRERLPVLWVAHDLEQLQRIADRHVCLDGASMESR